MKKSILAYVLIFSALGSSVAFAQEDLSQKETVKSKPSLPPRNVTNTNCALSNQIAACEQRDKERNPPALPQRKGLSASATSASSGFSNQIAACEKRDKERDLASSQQNQMKKGPALPPRNKLSQSSTVHTYGNSSNMSNGVKSLAGKFEHNQF